MFVLVVWFGFVANGGYLNMTPPVRLLTFSEKADCIRVGEDWVAEALKSNSHIPALSKPFPQFGCPGLAR